MISLVDVLSEIGAQVLHAVVSEHAAGGRICHLWAKGRPAHI